MNRCKIFSLSHKETGNKWQILWKNFRHLNFSLNVRTLQHDFLKPLGPAQWLLIPSFLQVSGSIRSSLLTNVDNVWSEHVWMYRQGYHRKFSLFSFFALILYIKNVNFHILICNNPPAKFLNLQHVFLLQLDQSNIISPAFYALYMLFIYIVQHLYNFSVHTRGERGLKESSYIHWRDIYL